VAGSNLLSRRSVVREYVHGAYWVLPALGIVIGLGAGALLSVIPVTPGSLIDKMMFQGTAGDARGVLIVVSATMITTTGIVFSLTVLSLQIASSQFSVRLLRTADVPPAQPAESVPLLAPRSGYLQTVEVDDIAARAATSGHTVQLVMFVGDYVTAGGLLGWCWRRGKQPQAPDPGFLQGCLRHVHIGFERTPQQDIRFGLRQLVDIALRALSLAINDPYTAIQVVHHVSAIESVLASRAIQDDVRRDDSGNVLVWLPYPGFAVYLHVACAQIRRYGTREPMVLAALLQMPANSRRHTSSRTGSPTASAMERYPSRSPRRSTRFRARSRARPHSPNCSNR
jgi:uncharacterized membrane protein